LIFLLLVLHAYLRTHTYMRVYERKRKSFILHERRHPTKKFFDRVPKKCTIFLRKD
jgi:hypothetical protein